MGRDCDKWQVWDSNGRHECAHDHRDGSFVGHRRSLRPCPQVGRLAGFRDGAQAGGHRRARGRRHRGLLSRLPRAGLDRPAGRGCAGAHRRHAGRALQQWRLFTARRRRGHFGRGPSRAVRREFLRLARSDDAHRPGDARSGSRPDRQLLVHHGVHAVQVSRAVCGVQTCGRGSDALPSIRTPRLEHSRFADRAGSGEVEDRDQRARLVPEERGSRELGAPRRLSGPTRPAERRRQRVADEARAGSRLHGVASRPPFVATAAALCGDLAGENRRVDEASSAAGGTLSHSRSALADDRIIRWRPSSIYWPSSSWSPWWSC